jgi:drug/metabolite transporter (DMT)-like permease
VIAGVSLAGVAVVLYAVASILQSVGARRVTASTHAPPVIRRLVNDPAWVLGVGLLALAFLFFVLSTRVLPLVLAEVIRAVYPVVTLVLEHLVMHTRIVARELVGAALVLLGPIVIVWSGGVRGQLPALSGTAVVMLIVLVAVLAASAALTRITGGRAVVAGATQAGLSGVAFTVVDMGVRSIPDPFSVVASIQTPACWIGAIAAPVGLLLFSRAAALVSAGLATVVLTVVNVVTASVWSVTAFHDTSDAGLGQYALAVVLAVIGVGLMTHEVRGGEAPRARR